MRTIISVATLVAALLVPFQPSLAHHPDQIDGTEHNYGDMVDYPLVFPVGGEEYRFSNDFWACRGNDCATFHHATDIMAPKMTPVYAVADGVIDHVNWGGSSCCTLTIDHDDGWESWYIHLNNDTPGTDDGLGWGIAPGIERGVHVDAGQLIGWVGDSGNAEWTGSHLHFELRDPENIIVNAYDALVAAPHVQEAPPVTCNELVATVIGTAEDDYLLGTSGNDVFAGLGGNDTIEGFGGDDIICAGDGDDTIRAGDGDDTIDGGPGADEIHGDGGSDHIDAGEGNDTAFGGDGNDHINGDAGNDWLFGDGGDDTLSGGIGHDRLFGNGGNDIIKGGPGQDRLEGGDDVDVLAGAAGNDTLLGGAGNDRLYPGPGTDVTAGGPGDDRIRSGPGDDHLGGGAGRDVVLFVLGVEGVTVNLSEGVASGIGNDTIALVERVIGSNGPDLLFGSAANDILQGAGGNDLIDGLEGDDRIAGGNGDDTLSGSAGDDIIVGGLGTDDIDGGDGLDECAGDVLVDCETIR